MDVYLCCMCFTVKRDNRMKQRYQNLSLFGNKVEILHEDLLFDKVSLVLFILKTFGLLLLVCDPYGM